MATNYHVTPHSNGWQVKGAGNERATSTHTTQAEAIEAGRELAIANEGQLFIHGRDGKIRDEWSYGNDPHPPKG